MHNLQHAKLFENELNAICASYNNSDTNTEHLRRHIYQLSNKIFYSIVNRNSTESACKGFD